ncbi:MAG: phosphate ABC transporter ATP-binding protein PstB [Halobacteriota archaeon]
MSGEIEIRIKNLNLWFGNFQALKNINIDIPKNTVTALIGPSGCGKSTFIKTLDRMNDLVDNVKFTGEVTYKGRNILDSDTDVVELRKEIGMVFQKPNPFPKSVFDNVAYGPKVHGIRKKQNLVEVVERSLKAAALWEEVKDRLNQSALRLSGGQQQRLCIARLLAVEPNVLLMDEPASALDPIATSKIEDLIYELKRDYTIIIVTHNMQQAARVATNTAFFYLGELVECAPTIDLFERPQNKRTEDYVTGKFG